MDNSFYVHVLAGKPNKINDQYSHNLIVDPNGNTLLENTLDQVLEASEDIGNVGGVVTTVKSGSDRLREKYSDYIDFMVARKKLMPSVIYGFLEGVVNKHFAGTEHEFGGTWNLVPSVKEYFNSQPQEVQDELRNLTVMYLASDIVFPDQREIVEFAQNYHADGAPDMYVRFTDLEKVSQMGKDLNIDFDSLDSTLCNGSVIDGKNYRVSNMFIVKPMNVILQGLTRPFQFIYNNRYLSENRALKVAAFAGLGLWMFSMSPSKSSAPRFLSDVYTMMSQIKGKKQETSMDSKEFEKFGSAFLGIDAKIDLTGGKSILDADDMPSAEEFKQHFQRIKDYKL